jgi:drug/metabolite transporter (DMT)-like permease
LISPIVSIHLAAFLFGMTGILGSLIQADPATITFGRAVFAVIALAVVLKLRPDTSRLAAPLPTAPEAFKSMVPQFMVSGLLLAVHWISFFISVKSAGVAIATLGFSSFAAFITVIEWRLAPQTVTRNDWIRLSFVCAGLALITPTLDLQNTDTYGFLMGLLSGLSFAAMAVYNSRRLTHVNPIVVARNQNLVVAAILITWTAPELLLLSLSSWMWLAVLGVFCTGLSHALFVFSLSHMRVNRAGLVIALEPVYAIAAAWLLFAQVPALRTLAGGVLIVSAILGIRYVNSRQTHPSKPLEP